MAIGTKVVKSGGSGKLPKSFIPGNHTAKINRVGFQKQTFSS